MEPSVVMPCLRRVEPRSDLDLPHPRTREIKSEEVEELTAELESQNAQLEKLTSEIAQLSDEVAEIKGQQKSATDNRLAEKKTNTATVADAKVAQAAVEKATTVLKEY
jgi:chorismate mutase